MQEDKAQIPFNSSQRKEAQSLGKSGPEHDKNHAKSLNNRCIWAEHQRRRSLGPRSNQPEEGGHGAAPPRCAHTPATASKAHSLLAVPSIHLGSVLGGFLIYLSQTDHGALYKKLPPSVHNNTHKRRAKQEQEHPTPWA